MPDHGCMQRMSLRRTFFKLMTNSVFGKTMENIRNHKYMKLVLHKWKDVLIQKDRPIDGR